MQLIAKQENDGVTEEYYCRERKGGGIEVLLRAGDHAPFVGVAVTGNGIIRYILPDQYDLPLLRKAMGPRYLASRNQTEEEAQYKRSR